MGLSEIRPMKQHRHKCYERWLLLGRHHLRTRDPEWRYGQLQRMQCTGHGAKHMPEFLCHPRQGPLPNGNGVHDKSNIQLWPRSGCEWRSKLGGRLHTAFLAQAWGQQRVEPSGGISRIALATRAGVNLSSILGKQWLRSQDIRLFATKSAPSRKHLQVLQIACLQPLRGLLPHSAIKGAGRQKRLHPLNHLASCQEPWHARQASRFPDRMYQAALQAPLHQTRGIEQHLATQHRGQHGK